MIESLTFELEKELISFNEDAKFKVFKIQSYTFVRNYFKYLRSIGCHIDKQYCEEFNIFYVPSKEEKTQIKIQRRLKK